MLGKKRVVEVGGDWVVVKKPPVRRVRTYLGSFGKGFSPPAGTAVARKLGGYTRRGFQKTAGFTKRLFRESKGGIVSFFTDPHGYANRILIVFLSLFVIAFFGPAIYDFSIIAVMGFLGVLKMLLQFFLILFEFPINTALEMLSGMLNALAGVIGSSVGAWHFDINGDGVFTSLYHLSHNVILEIPNVYLSTNFWDYTIVSYLTNWGSASLPGVTSTTTTTSVSSFSGHAAAVSRDVHIFIGKDPSAGWLNQLVSVRSLQKMIPFA